MCVGVGCVHISVGALREQKNPSDLELELWLMWVLGPRPRSSEGTATALSP